MQTAIPCVFFRGGSSRGPFFHRSHLPEDEARLAEVLIAVEGAGHPLQIDGVGGGATVTSKVAMISRSDHEWAEIDYFFAQVAVQERQVDFAPNCGNMLSAVGPFAIEQGLIPALDGETTVRIRNTNTGALTEAVIKTPGGEVSYDGDATIDGVPGSAAPVVLNFMDVVGSKCGALFPTGKPVDVFDGIEVTCIDVAMPMVLARAADFGLTGHESAEEIDANRDFYARMEPIRRAAGERMGLGDVSEKVVPKFGLLAAPARGGSIASRYFVPDACHRSHAVTGALCVGSCALQPGTVAEGLAKVTRDTEQLLRIEHPSGVLDVRFTGRFDGGYTLEKAGLVRTARKIWSGEIYVPDRVWGGL